MGQHVEVPVIWKDESLLVVNKPPGLLTLPDGYDPTAPHLKSVLSPKHDPLWIVHRLDRDTSGVIVLARSSIAHRHLNTQFQERSVLKIYHALVVGESDWDRKIIDLPLKVDGDRRHRTIVDIQNGKESVTRFKVLERFERFSLVEAEPESGRRHQIRAHLLAADLPLAGDALYGGHSKGELPLHNDSGVSAMLTRTALHARSIKLAHPITEEEILLKARYPKDFESVLHVLRNEVSLKDITP